MLIFGSEISMFCINLVLHIPLFLHTFLDDVRQMLGKSRVTLLIDLILKYSEN